MRTFQDFGDLGAIESVEVVSGPRLLWVNDKQLESDFPNVSDLTTSRDATRTTRDIRRSFLLENCRVLSTSLTNPNTVVKSVKLEGEKRNAYRPPFYGRAFVIEARPTREDGFIDEKANSVGLFDMKGVGTPPNIPPLNSMYQTGVLSAVSAFRELVNQVIIERISQAAQVDISGVPLYAIIDLGLRGPSRLFLNDCAYVILVRGAHKRLVGGSDLARFGSKDQKAQELVEDLLYSYGLTSAKPDRTVEILRNNKGVLSLRYLGKSNPNIMHHHIERLLQECDVSVAPDQKKIFYAINVQLASGSETNPLHARIVDFHQYRPVFDELGIRLSLVDDKPLNWGNFLSCRAVNNPRLNIEALTEQPIPEQIRSKMHPSFGKTAIGADLFGMRIALMIENQNATPESVSFELERFLDQIT